MRRQIFYTATANRQLTRLAPTGDEFQSISLQLRDLALKPTLGYPVPFQEGAKKLFRFDVGRFSFIYTYSKDELNVINVI
jgi:mRNA-degrading endonuclease RelE of RelBE toxin-antitoxin system